MSWKGSDERSGGIVTNIGIHFFDLLLWLFGPVAACEVHLREPRRDGRACSSSSGATCAGFCRPIAPICRSRRSPASKTTFRSITVDGEEVEFSEGFADLHTRVYEEMLAGRGFGIADARPCDRAVAPHPPGAGRSVAAHLHPMALRRRR